jgi:hypothetical protein
MYAGFFVFCFLHETYDADDTRIDKRKKDEQLKKKKMNKQLMRKTDYNQHTHTEKKEIEMKKKEKLTSTNE